MTIISSGIYPIDPTITDGTQLAGYINELVEAINSQQASSTRPPMITKGGLWTKTISGSDIAVMVYDGTNDVEIGKVTGGEIILGGDTIWKEVIGSKSKYANYEDGWVRADKGASLRNGSDASSVSVGGNGSSLAKETTGIQNSAFGTSSLEEVTSGKANSAFGNRALQNLDTGDTNTALGYKAGSTLISGENNIIIGNDSQPSSTTVSNEITLGNAINNKIRAGNGDVIWSPDTYGRFKTLRTFSQDYTGFTQAYATYKIPIPQGMIDLGYDNTYIISIIGFGANSTVTVADFCTGVQGGGNTLNEILVTLKVSNTTDASVWTLAFFAAGNK